MIAWGERNREQGRGYWHQMGIEATDPDATATAEFERAGLDYEIAKRPLMTRNARGHMLTIPDHFALVSDASGDADVIAVVGREFEPVQNMHIATMLDKSGLVGPGGKYSVDVTGKTSDGRTVFTALKAREPFTINGDTYRDHWLLADGKDGNRALTFALTPVRHICSNALAMAIAGATIKVAIHHTKVTQSELAWWLSIAPQLEQASIKSRDVLSKLGTVNVDADFVDEVLTSAYPKPAVRGKAQLHGLVELKLDDESAMSVDRAYSAQGTAALRQLRKIEAVRELFTSYADTPDERSIAGTALGLINAVADFENHREATSARETVGVSNMMGQRHQAQALAIKTTIKLAGIKV